MRQRKVERHLPPCVYQKHGAYWLVRAGLYADHPNMGNRMLSVLRSVFAYALEAELVDMNPCVGVRRHTERWRERLITAAEFKRSGRRQT